MFGRHPSLLSPASPSSVSGTTVTSPSAEERARQVVRDSLSLKQVCDALRLLPKSDGARDLESVRLEPLSIAFDMSKALASDQLELLLRPEPAGTYAQTVQ